MKKNLIILTENKMKKNAVNELFSNEFYNIEFIEIINDPKYSSVFLFSDEAVIDCEQRIFTYVAKYGGAKDKNTFIISIKTKIMIDKYNDENWINFCIVGVMLYNSVRYFTIYPEIVDIDMEFPIFYHRIFSEIDSEINKLHKYIFDHKNSKKIFNSSVRCINDEDRLNQIKFALFKVKQLIDNDYQCL